MIKDDTYYTFLYDQKNMFGKYFDYNHTIDNIQSHNMNEKFT